MAAIVLGIGSSHTPMLNARLEDWPRFIELDRMRAHLDRRGNPVNYAQLLALAGDEVAPSSDGRKCWQPEGTPAPRSRMSSASASCCAGPSSTR